MKRILFGWLLCFLSISRLLAYDIEQAGIYYNILEDGPLGTVEITHAGYPNTYSDTVSVPHHLYLSGGRGLGRDSYSVVSIGDWAFVLCRNLKCIRCRNVDYIGAYAFYGCTQLTNLDLPDGIIREHAFENCSGVTSIVIADNSGNMSIADSAFTGCKKLAKITCYPKIPPTVSANAFAGLDLGQVRLDVPFCNERQYRNDPIWGQMDIHTITIPYPTDYKYLSGFGVLTKFSLTLILWLCIIALMYYFATRNPTGYDTNYRHRLRIVLGVIVAVMWLSRFLICVLKAPQLFSQYCLYYYGANWSPTDVVYGRGTDPLITIVPRFVTDVAVFAIPTYEDYLIFEAVHSLGLGIATSLYMFLFRRTACTKWAKVRKFIGYTLLLLIVPQVLDMRYFDINDWLSAAVVLLLVWLCTRTYKRDAVVSVPLVESQHAEVVDFSAIAPEEVNVYPTSDILPIENQEKRQVHIIEKHSMKKKIKNIGHACAIKLQRLSTQKSLPTILGIIATCLLLTAIISLCTETYIVAMVAYCLCFPCFVMWGVIVLKKLRNIQQNVHAYRLCVYWFINFLLEMILLPIFWEEFIYDYFFELILPLLMGIFIIKPLASMYLYRCARKEYRFDYLMPNWLRQSIKRYSTDQVAIRSAIVFVLYPTFYIMALPFGAYAILYVFPVLFLFYLFLFVSWIGLGTSTPSKEEHTESDS